MGTEYNRAALRQLIMASFDEDELLVFCFDYFPEVNEHFSAEMSRMVKVIVLIEFCERHGQIEALLNLLRAQRPFQFGKFETSIYREEGGTEAAEDVYQVLADKMLAGLTDEQLTALLSEVPDDELAKLLIELPDEQLAEVLAEIPSEELAQILFGPDDEKRA